MAVTYSWEDPERTIVRLEFAGDWTWEELHIQNNEVRRQIIELGHRVDVIVDLSRSPGLPPNTLVNFRQIAAKRAANAAIIVVVGASTLVKTVYSAFSRVYRVFHHKLGVHFVKTVGEAHQYLAQERMRPTKADTAKADT